MRPDPELVRESPRKRYLLQLVRYGWPTWRWIRRLNDFHRDAVRYQATRLPKQLGAVLWNAQRATRYYPERFSMAGVHAGDFRTAPDLRSYPTLSRRDLQQRFEDLLSTRIDRSVRDEGIVWKTSGSTGEPVRFFADGGSNKFPLALYRFWMGRGPGRPFSQGVVLLCALPRSTLVKAWLPLFGGTWFRKLHWSEPGALAWLSGADPSVITGDPDSLKKLDDVLADGMRLRPRLIVSSAFTLPAELSESLARRTGARVVDCYSIAETGPLAWRCAPDRPFHVLGAAAHLETLASGELAVTNLRNPYLPLIRYRTGDLGTVETVSCPCGFRGPGLPGLTGRLAARFRSASGELVDPSRVEPVLTRLPIHQFQLIQENADLVALRYHGPAAIGETPDLNRALTNLLGSAVRTELIRSREPLWRDGEKPVPYLARAR